MNFADISKYFAILGGEKKKISCLYTIVHNSKLVAKTSVAKMSVEIIQ